MKNFSNAAPCFSGTCGLCVNCCGSYHAAPVIANGSALEQNIDRSKMWKNESETMTQEYWKDLRLVYQKYSYASPEEPGSLPRTLHVDNGPFTSKTYHLHQQKHEKVCHMPACQMMHHDMHEHQRRIYQGVPVYAGTHCTLCYPCIRDMDRIHL